jgi:hypothetical protein
MRTQQRHIDYNRPLTGERALIFPADHAVRHRPVLHPGPLRTPGFVRIVR